MPKSNVKAKRIKTVPFTKKRPKAKNAPYQIALKPKKGKAPFSKAMLAKDANLAHPVRNNVNTAWFKMELEKNNITQRALASALGLDPSGVSLLLNGRRRFQMSEAVILAQLLGHSLDTILSNTGAVGAKVEIGSTPMSSVLGETSEPIEVTGILVDGLKVESGPIRGPKQVPGIQGGSLENVEVYRVQTAGTSFSGLDGALVYFRVRDGVDSSAIGKPAIIVTQEGDMHLRVLKRGYSEGKYDLTLLNGEITHEDVVVKACHPVLWLKL